MDKSKDGTNISSASHPILGTFITGSGENLLPADLNATNKTNSLMNSKYNKSVKQGTEMESSGAGFLEGELDYSAENIKIGGHDDKQRQALLNQTALQNMYGS